MSYQEALRIIQELKNPIDPEVIQHLQTGSIDVDHAKGYAASCKWLKNGELHRERGPAVVEGIKAYPEYDKQEWFLEGKRHREDGPAVITVFGTEWFLQGKWHREGGPAVEHKTFQGDIMLAKWLKHGEPDQDLEYNYFFMGAQKKFTKNWIIHKDDGPAVAYANGRQEWFQNGKRHREDGPAVIQANGKEKYYLGGKLCKTQEIFETEMARKNEHQQVQTVCFKI